MRAPEFRDAEYTTTNVPVVDNKTTFIKKLLTVMVYIGIFIFSHIIVSLSFCFFDLNNDTGYSINVLSIGASAITLLSAIISVLTLLDSECKKKYQDDIILLEKRYLNNYSVSSWEFLKRSSNYSLKKQSHNYYIKSACYKLFSDNNDNKSLEIIVPILSVDIHDVPCIIQIIRIKNFIPQYIDYIYSEQKKLNGKDIIEPNYPNYFIPLPFHLIAIYKNVLLHKIINRILIILFMLIINYILLSIFIIIGFGNF